MFISRLEGTFPVPHNVIEDEKFRALRLSSKYLYCYLAKLSNRYPSPDGWFWRPMDQLSQEVGINIKTLKKAKKELLANNFIEVRRGAYKGTNRRSADNYKVRGFKQPSPSPAQNIPTAGP